MKGKRKERKKEKKGKKGGWEMGESIRGRIRTKSNTLKGGEKIYVPTICTVLTEDKLYHFGKGERI